MPLRQKIFAILICVAVFFTIIELVRRRKLREEYSWFWLMTGAALFVLVIRYDWLVAITHFIGAKVPTSMLFLLGIIFLILMNLHFSLVLSRFADQIKNLNQEVALLKNRLEEKSPEP